MNRLPGKMADMFSSDDPGDPSSEAANNARDGAARKVATWMSASFGRSVRQQASVEALPSIFLRLMLLFSADMVDIKIFERGGERVEVGDRTVGQRAARWTFGGQRC